MSIENKAEQIKSCTNHIDLKVLLLAVVLLQFVIIFYLTNPGGVLPEAEESMELTKYQQNYVDCPADYLEVCTKLSKVPTAEVTFQKVEDGKIYLEMDDGRTMIAELQGKEDAEIVAMK